MIILNGIRPVNKTVEVKVFLGKWLLFYLSVFLQFSLFCLKKYLNPGDVFFFP